MDIKGQINGKLRDVASFVKNADEKTLYYFLGGVLLIFLVLDYLILMRPQISAMTKAASQIMVLDQENSTTETNILRLNSYRNQIKELKEGLEKSQYKIRSREEIPVILERISRLASDYGLKIDQIKPDMQDQKVILNSTEREYTRLPFTIYAKSGYHDFGKFLAQAEQNEILFKVGSFSITPTDNINRQDIRLTIETIIYDEKKK
ncbi:MAG: type 4a pilus biogenesis protein PilO [Candidatus Omnitrophica bacterium]|nr:type 4a pilus biogenesis protein PilO [Candidatus Omnitrophota bacterium]